MQWSMDIRQIRAAIFDQAFLGRTQVSCSMGRVVGIRQRKGQLLAMVYGWVLDDYCFCRCCQLLNSKKGCFFALSMAHVFQTILSVDVKEKAIAALISTLKMVHSAPLLIIDATGTSNRLPSPYVFQEIDLSLFRAKDAKS